MGQPMRAISDRPIRHGGLTATSPGSRNRLRGEAAERRQPGPSVDTGDVTIDYRPWCRKGKSSLRVPMVDEDSGDPSVGVELIHLDLEPAHVAPKIDGHRVHAGEDIEEIEFQLRRGRQRLRKVGAQRGLPRTVPAGSPSTFVTSSDVSSTASA